MHNQPQLHHSITFTNTVCAFIASSCIYLHSYYQFKPYCCCIQKIGLISVAGSHEPNGYTKPVIICTHYQPSACKHTVSVQPQLALPHPCHHVHFCIQLDVQQWSQNLLCQFLITTTTEDTKAPLYHHIPCSTKDHMLRMLQTPQIPEPRQHVLSFTPGTTS